MTRSAALVAFCGSALVALFACAEPTEVVVRVHADPGVAAAIDHLELRASDGASEPREASSHVSAGDYPRTLGLLDRGGASGPITVVVSGSAAGEVRVQARARFSFVEGESRRLELRLHDACLDRFACTGETTCGPTGACVPMDARTDPR